MEERDACYFFGKWCEGSKVRLHIMFIDVKIEERNNVFWRLTGMYGEFCLENKHLTWSSIRQLHQTLSIPWLLIGDLNEIQSLHEKEGDNPRPQQYMMAFQTAIEDCELRDRGFVGDRFTWQMGRIRERLDMGMINDAWSVLFHEAALENLKYNHSDRRPLLVNTEYYSLPNQAGLGQPRRFEARWLRENGLMKQCLMHGIKLGVIRQQITFIQS